MRFATQRRSFGAAILAPILWLAAATPCSAGVLSGPLVNPANGHEYYLLTQDDWTASETEAVALGGHLATIRDAAENQWIYDNFSTFGGSNRVLWIGLNDELLEGTFVWSSGETPGQNLWAPGQPDNNLGLEHFVHLFPPLWANAGQWNDFPDQTFFATYPCNGVVEVIPPPGSLFVNYCTAGSSASGCQAVLSGSGVASASAPSGFSLDASAVEGGKNGLYFFGTNGRQANSWGNGTSFQCVVPPVKRAGLLTGTGSIGQCDGTFSQDLNAVWTATPAKNPGAGAVVQAQLWYRDAFNTSNQKTSLSDAIEFVVAP